MVEMTLANKASPKTSVVFFTKGLSVVHPTTVHDVAYAGMDPSDGPTFAGDYGPGNLESQWASRCRG